MVEIAPRYVFDHGCIYDIRDPVIARYMEGGCYALAIAHHRITRWPLIVMGSATAFEHALVVHPSGRLVDICGAHDADELARAWGGTEYTRLTEDALWSALPLPRRCATLGGLAEAKNVIAQYLNRRFPEIYA